MISPTLVTGTIIARNEEDRIAGAIASLSCCDEVLVVDSGSTDQTQQIAEQCGARVIVRAWKGYADQKNFAASQAAHDWVLSVDADERLSAELSNEIVAWKQRPSGGKCAGASMPRRVFYLGSWIRHSGWYPDRKLRLYDRRRGRWVGNFIHEKLAVDGEQVAFSGDLLHLPYLNWKDHVRRIDHYTQLAADEAKIEAKTGRNGGSIVRMLAGPPLSFLKTFVLRAGFLDGWRGAVIAYAAARYVFLRELRKLR